MEKNKQSSIMCYFSQKAHQDKIDNIENIPNDINNENNEQSSCSVINSSIRIIRPMMLIVVKNKKHLVKLKHLSAQLN
jgi:hypothetical protein